MNNHIQKYNDTLKKKAVGKLKKLFSLPDAILSDASIVEQASSEATAKFASSFVKSTDIVADLTGGLGVNTYFFALKAKEIFCIEKDKRRAEALEWNFSLSGLSNVEVINEDCIRWLESNDKKFDLVFIDPARRNSQGKRFVFLNDCTPDLKEILPLISGRCRQILIKVSPLLDLTSAFKEIPVISEIYILEYKREVKELILKVDCEKETSNRIIECVFLSDDKRSRFMRFKWGSDNSTNSCRYLKSVDEIQNGGYLYEPAPSIMKAGMFSQLFDEYHEIYKLDPNTHLFFSLENYENFPGRAFKIVSRMKSSDLKRCKGEEFNVISRNHPAKSTELTDKYRLNPSDKRFLIACKVGGKPVIFFGEKKTAESGNLYID